MSAMLKTTEQIILEYKKYEISISISRAYRQYYKNIIDNLFLPAYKQEMSNHSFLNLEVEIYL